MNITEEQKEEAVNKELDKVFCFLEVVKKGIERRKQITAPALRFIMLLENLSTVKDVESIMLSKDSLGFILSLSKEPKERIQKRQEELSLIIEKCDKEIQESLKEPYLTSFSRSQVPIEQDIIWNENTRWNQI